MPKGKEQPCRECNVLTRSRVKYGLGNFIYKCEECKTAATEAAQSIMDAIK